MSGEPCKHCGQAFVRKPKSVAAYCSNKCRAASREAAELATLRMRDAAIRALLDAPPREVTDIAVVTYPAHAVVWKTRGGASGICNPDADGERTFAVTNFYQMPDYVRAAMVEWAPDIIPPEIAALAPDPMEAIKLHRVETSSLKQWLGRYGDAVRASIPIKSRTTE